ncbi:MAG: oligosaccharide flippase family protein [Fibromonadales bacterium]|nr:oligosaccharide flippase family protein [Fibromonadales bacterium]
MSIETDKKFLLKSTLYNLLGTILRVVAPALMFVLARIFGKEEFGIFVSTQLLVFTLSRVSAFGLSYGLHRFLPQNEVNNRPFYLGFNESIRHVLTISFIILAVLFAGIAFGLQKYSESLAVLSSLELSVYALSVVPLAILHIFGGATEGMRKPQYKIFITDCATYTLAPLISIALHFAGIPNALPAGLLIAISLGCIIYIPLIKKILPFSLDSFKSKIPRELLLYSIPRWISDMVGSILVRIDIWLVLLFLGPGQAGIYAVMITISAGLRTIRQGFTPILMPVVAGMSKDRLGTDLKPVFSYCINMIAIIQLCIGFFIVLFPDKILMIAGKEFIVQPETLGILMLSHLLSGFFMPAGDVLNGIGKSLYTLKLDIISLCVAFTASYLLIPILGLPGAALSTFAYILLQCIWNNIYIFKLNLKLYSSKIIPYLVWAIFLSAVYILLPNFSLELWHKIVFYIIALCGLAITHRALK